MIYLLSILLAFFASACGSDRKAAPEESPSLTNIVCYLLERIVGIVLISAISLTFSPHDCFAKTKIKLKEQTHLTQRQAASKITKAKITRRAPKSKKETGLRVTLIPLQRGSHSVRPIQFDVLKKDLKYSPDMEALIEELKELGASEELNVRNQCLAGNNPGGVPNSQNPSSPQQGMGDRQATGLPASADERTSSRMDPANLDSCGSLKALIDEARASAGLDPNTKLKNCIAQNRMDLLKTMEILPCLAPNAQFLPQNFLATLMNISGDLPETVDPNPIEHVADWSITQGISINDRGEVGAAGSFSVNGVGGHGSITPHGDGSTTFTGGPMFGETYSFTTPANGQSQSHQPKANTPTGRATTGLTDADIAEVAAQNPVTPPPQSPPPKEEEEEKDPPPADPPSDETTTTPIDPESGGSQIPEECQQEMMDQAKERGELTDYNGDPGRTDPEEPGTTTGQDPVVLTCFEEFIRDSSKQDDCELDQRTFRDPDQPSACAEQNSKEAAADPSLWDHNYGTIDPEGPDSGSGGNGGGNPSTEPDCEMNPTDPRCINPE